MELNSQAKRVWDYCNQWAHLLPTADHVDAFVNSNNKLSDDDKELFKQMWLKFWGMEDCCEVDDLDSMTKLELDNYAKEAYDIELDRRQTKENMLKELDEALGYYNEE